MKYQNVDWWIRAEGDLHGYETFVFVYFDTNKKEIHVIPEEYKKRIDTLIERRPAVAGLPLPPKGSFTQLFFIVKDRFFDVMPYKLEYEGEFEKVEKIDPNVVY